MGIFSKKQEDLSIPQNRTLGFNPSGRELEWMDAVEIWEDQYADLHFKHGWKTVKGKGFRETNDRFKPVHWQVGEIIVIAKFDSETGVVTEKIKP